MRLILYALGRNFEHCRDRIHWEEVVAVSDCNKNFEQQAWPVPFVMPEKILNIDYDYVVIFSDRYFDEIRRQLAWEYMIPSSRVISWHAIFPNDRDMMRLAVRWLKDAASKDECKEILDFGRLNLASCCLTKNDIAGCSQIKIYGIGDGGGNFNAIFYDEIIDSRCLEGRNFDYVLMGSPMGFEAVEISKAASWTGCLIFISSWKDMMETISYEKILSKFGRVIPVAVAEGILWLVYTLAPSKLISDISVYVVMHKAYPVKTEYPYIPFCVGGYFRPGYLSEKDGDNISHLNSKINECTAMYWIWKNTSSEYVGLNHYRRYFFRNTLLSIDNFIDITDMTRWLRDYDMILSETWITELTVKQVMRQSVNEKLFDVTYELFRQIFGKYQGEYLDAFDSVLGGHVMFRCNMFIMKKDIFDMYCKWLFSFLVEVAETIDLEGYDDYSKRIIGFFAERMLTVWLWKNHFRIKQLPIVVPGSP